MIEQVACGANWQRSCGLSLLLSLLISGSVDKEYQLLVFLLSLRLFPETELLVCVIDRLLYVFQFALP